MSSSFLFLWSWAWEIYSRNVSRFSDQDLESLFSLIVSLRYLFLEKRSWFSDQDLKSLFSLIVSLKYLFIYRSNLSLSLFISSLGKIGIFHFGWGLAAVNLANHERFPGLKRLKWSVLVRKARG